MNVSVIISNYNYAEYVGSAIGSCLKQTVEPKIIIVDDCSSDGSWEIITRYTTDHKNVTGVRLKVNSGGNARGKNVGICLADTEFVTCLDSDDMLLPNSIETRLNVFSDDIDFVQGWSITVYGQESYNEFIKNGVLNRPFKQNRKAKNLATEKNTPRWSFAIQASTVLSKRCLYDRMGLYDEEMKWSIDREMWWRWLSHSAKLKIIDEYVSLYRCHKGQVTGDRNRKNPKKQQALLKHRQEMRKQLAKENTMFPESYDFMSYVDKVISL